VRITPKGSSANHAATRDEVVEPTDMQRAIEESLDLAEEPPDEFRRYMASIGQ
jgi:hypothetical protein